MSGELVQLAEHLGHGAAGLFVRFEQRSVPRDEEFGEGTLRRVHVGHQILNRAKHNEGSLYRRHVVLSLCEADQRYPADDHQREDRYEEPADDMSGGR